VRRIAILLVASLGLAEPAWDQTTPGVRVRPLLSGCITTAFVGVTVVPMDSRRILSDQVVLVQDERIRELGPRNDWLCWSRFDSASIFETILDPEIGGAWRIRPTQESNVSRRYIDDTNVLETTFSAHRARLF
jgi:hypothetical protein